MYGAVQTMVKSLEESVDALPDSIESYIEKKAQQSITDELFTEERGLASNIEEDVKELASCIDAIDNFNFTDGNLIWFQCLCGYCFQE